MNRLPDLMLVSCMLHQPKDDNRIMSCRTEDGVTTLIIKDAPPDYRHVSAEFMAGWTWEFAAPDNSADTTTIVLDRKKCHAKVSGNVCGINNLPLVVTEVRTVGVHCSRAYPMMMTNAGVFLLHPQLRVKVGDRLVCTVGGGVEYLGGEKQIACVQVAFGQHWSASHAEIITKLWDAGY